MLATKTPATPSRYPLRGVRFAVAAAAAALLLASATTARAATLPVGNVATFSTGSTAGNPAGSWTLGDKIYTYLSGTDSGWDGSELITLSDNTALSSHSLTVGNLFSLTGPGTFILGYRLSVVPSSSNYLNTVDLDVTHLTDNVIVYKDGYATLDDFTNNTSPGSGTVFALSSTNGAPDGPVSIPGMPTQVWVRDTIVLDATGTLASVKDTVTQAVPEIDATSFAGAFPLLMGGLALLERRRRRTPADAALGVCG